MNPNTILFFWTVYENKVYYLHIIQVKCSNFFPRFILQNTFTPYCFIQQTSSSINNVEELCIDDALFDFTAAINDVSKKVGSCHQFPETIIHRESFNHFFLNNPDEYEIIYYDRLINTFLDYRVTDIHWNNDQLYYKRCILVEKIDNLYKEYSTSVLELNL